MKTKKNSKKLLTLSCLFCLSVGGLLAVVTSNNVKVNDIAVHAANEIETSTGITMNANDSAYFTTTTKVEKKVLVFEVKTDGTETQFQLRGSSGAGGIIRTKPDRGVDTADAVSYENQGGSPYWGSECYSVDIGDGWYRWVVDLTHYKGIDTLTDAVRIKCLKGTGVQVRNLKFYDEMYIEASGLCGDSYGYVDNQFANFATQTIQFDIRLTDDTQRRIQLCKDSGGGLTGLIVCTKNQLKYENAAYESGGTEPYWAVSDTAPESLGDNWYRFVVDLTKVKVASGRAGTETVVKVKNIPDTGDGTPSIEMKNFGIYAPPYNPADDADLVLPTNTRTAIPDIDYWHYSKISFEVYHDSLDLAVDPQFIFGQKGSESNITSYFGYKNINGETALYLRNAGEGSYWVKSTYQPEDVGNGWYKWTIDLAELRPNAATGGETIGNIYNRGANDVYVRNFAIESSYNPANDADMTWAKNNNALVDEKGDAVAIEDWAIDATLSFKVFDFNAVFPKSGNSMSFASEKANESSDITKDNRTSDKFYSDGNGHLVAASNNSIVVGTYEAIADEKGWYQVTINCDDVPEYSGGSTRALRYIRIASDSTIYVKDLAYTEAAEKPYDAKVYDHGFIELTQEIENWKMNTLSFKTFGPICPAIGMSNNTTLSQEGEGNNLSANFLLKDGQVESNGNIVGTYTELTGDDAGWYQWTINLGLVPSKNGNKGIETATYLWVKTTNAKFTTFFFKDIEASVYNPKVFVQGAEAYLTNYDNGGVLRILGFFDDILGSNGKALNCSNYGITINLDGKEEEIDDLTLYESIRVYTNGTSELITASDYEANSISGVEIYNIPIGEYQFTVYSWLFIEDISTKIKSDVKTINVVVDEDGTHVSLVE